jgi:hypothetical protein
MHGGRMSNRRAGVRPVRGRACASRRHCDAGGDRREVVRPTRRRSRRIAIALTLGVVTASATAYLALHTPIDDRERAGGGRARVGAAMRHELDVRERLPRGDRTRGGAPAAEALR